MEERLQHRKDVLKMIKAVLLKQYRLDLKIKSTVLSKELPFNNSRLSQLENAYYHIPEDTAKVILDKYEVTYEEYLQRAEKITDDLYIDIAHLRSRSPWMTLYRCTTHIFEREIRKGYSIYSKMEESA